jgi:hypothetical protein
LYRTLVRIKLKIHKQLSGVDGMEDVEQKRKRLEQLIKDMDESKLDSMLEILLTLPL